jgi:hypothetical protein
MCAPSVFSAFLCFHQHVRMHLHFCILSKYPPEEPGALRWLAPQRGLTATAGKRPLTRPRPSATLSPREREKKQRTCARNYYGPLRGERVAAMRRRVRGLFQRWAHPQNTDSWIRRTLAASPAEPGGLPTTRPAPSFPLLVHATPHDLAGISKKPVRCAGQEPERVQRAERASYLVKCTSD